MNVIDMKHMYDMRGQHERQHMASTSRIRKHKDEVRGAWCVVCLTERPCMTQGWQGVVFAGVVFGGFA